MHRAILGSSDIPECIIKGESMVHVVSVLKSTFYFIFQNM